ncbi:hypothetical protein HY642_01460 [Candidatus Woesearchaeota archaeon]|nr:hypothetical protein [Candidatus Woesearchaeota archaeon]
MPHQCVRCNTFYEDGAGEILKGCPCGGRLFFYIKQEKLEQAKKLTAANLTTEQKTQMEQDVFNLMGMDKGDVPVVLDFESVRVLSPGKYELDLVNLFKNEHVIFQVGEGKYVIDIPETFRSLSRRK